MSLAPLADLLLHLLLFAAGVALVARVLFSATITFVLPRSAPDRITRGVFRAVRRLFDLRVTRLTTYESRDRAMALYAPTALLLLLPTWIALVILGYIAIFRALGAESWLAAFKLSGSCLLTLGFADAKDPASILASFSEATIGLILVALLIAYLPTMYAGFSRRETTVTMLEVRAGSPPTVVDFFARFQRIHGWVGLSDFWQTWEVWFSDIEETHTSLPALAFFRSPQANRSWLTAAGAVLDAAAFAQAVVDIPRDPSAQLCIRAGYLALRRIADFFGIAYNPTPAATDPISITRGEFDAACDALAAQNVPLKPDRDQAWRDFVGWRVNYDTVLLALAGLIMAPYAPWSSDRGLRAVRPGRIGRPRT